MPTGCKAHRLEILAAGVRLCRHATESISCAATAQHEPRVLVPAPTKARCGPSSLPGRAVTQLLSTLRASLLEQERLARTDARTGVYGRRAFEERLEYELVRARRRQSPLTLAYLDLDNFKLVNDTFGHAEGDRVLQTTALALSKAIRQTDTAARLGGDEATSSHCFCLKPTRWVPRE